MDFAETIKNACAVAIIGLALSLLMLPKVIHLAIDGLRALGAN